MNPLLCAYCGQTRMWPDDFPVRHFAKCRVCNHLDEPTMKVRIHASVVFCLGIAIGELLAWVMR